MLEEMRKPGEEVAFNKLPKEVQLIMRNVPFDLEELNLNPAISAVKAFEPYMWTYASAKQIWLYELAMADSYVQGVIDGKRTERAKRKRSINHAS